MLPNFIILGAQKAGTTTLAAYCETHPDIFFSQPRETQFFIQPNLHSKGVEQYEVQFFSGWNGQRAIGEKTPEYLVDAGAPALMRNMLHDDLKFIVLVRSPAARAYSGYRQNLRLFRESEDFETALRLEPGRTAGGPAWLTTFGYLARGHYARQIRNYMAAFPDFLERMLLIDIIDLEQRQKETFNRFCAHVGVDAHTVPENIRAGRGDVRPSVEFVDGEIMVRGTPVRNPSPALRQFAKKNAAARGAHGAEGLSRARELEINRDVFADSIHDLEVLTGRSFAHWLDA